MDVDVQMDLVVVRINKKIHTHVSMYFFLYYFLFLATSILTVLLLSFLPIDFFIILFTASASTLAKQKFSFMSISPTCLGLILAVSFKKSTRDLGVIPSLLPTDIKEASLCAETTG